MFQSIRLPGLGNRANRPPAPESRRSETGWHGRRLTTGIAIGATAAAVASLLATRTPAPALDVSTGALVPAPELGAVGRYQAACGRGEPDACNALGVLYQSGRDVPRDPFTAVAFFSGACGSGHADG